ncbi:MAG: SPOR domain-containing protein, partial [Spirochaetota bacterium]
MQISCFSKMYRVLKFTDYDSQDSVLFSGDGSQEWKAIEPETMIESLYGAVCPQKPVALVHPLPKERKFRTAETQKPTEPNPSAYATPSIKEGYSIQIGAFKSRQNARYISQKFQKKGYNSRIYKGKTKDNRILYKVLIGNYQSKEEVTNLAHEIKSKENINVYIYRQPPLSN